MRVILFNLFPYRVLRENRQRRRIYGELCAGALLGALLCYAVGAEFSDRVAEKQGFLSNLSAMESELATRVAEVQAMKDRVAVLGRQVNALQAVERESLLASRWMSYLDGTVPENVSLSRVMVQDGVMTVSGSTDAVSGLAAWVDKMEAGNSLFKAVDLVSVTDPGSSNNTGSAAPENSRHLFEIKAILRGADDAAR